MPRLKFNAPIPGIQICSSEEKHAEIRLECRLKARKFPCPHCLSKKTRVKAYRTRQLKHGFWNSKLVTLRVKIPKLYCPSCRRYAMARVPGVLAKRRATEQFRQGVFQLHQGGITQKNLSETHAISASTVERWYQSFVGYRVKELSGRSCPVVLGIDEHFFSRKKGFATTLVDLRNHKVFDVVLGKDELTLGAYLAKLPGREKVKVVVMDLCENFRRVVKKYFPNAKIVADRFHVIRWVNHQFLKQWGDIDPVARKTRGVLAAMRKHPWNLTPKQADLLSAYFVANPAMKAIYDFKNGLLELLLKKHQKRKEARDLIPQLLWYIEECRKSGLARFEDLSRTLKRWLEPIACMWRFTKSNGITEGLHNKMEMISRRAFGFRNFNNYRLRVIALCGWSRIFTIRN